MVKNPSSVSSSKLLDQVRDKLRVKHYSLRTEKTYVDWIKRYIWFHDKRHPRQFLAEAYGSKKPVFGFLKVSFKPRIYLRAPLKIQNPKRDKARKKF